MAANNLLAGYAQPCQAILHIRHEYNGGHIHGAILKTGICEKPTRKDVGSSSNKKRLKLSSDQGFFSVSSSSDISSYEWGMSQDAGSRGDEE